MATKTYPFDVVDFFKDDEDIAGYLEEMLAIDDPKVTARAVATIERAKNLPEDPSLDFAGRLNRAVHALGLRLAAVPVESRAA
ncbi:DNA-binding protein [Brevundimonas aurifodinae]|uniref:Addiction module antidote protein n=2 Tax=Brevundimonas TaxID=41275 RepID=A0ABV1NSQ7_9CAUL|nr:MAG: hypothetical protein B7Z01_07660 [Brevundimonas subvibrioides]